MPESSRIYVDTCCFIDLVRTEIGKGVDPSREETVWYVKKLMEAHRDGEVTLFTSTLTIAECRHAGEGQISDDIKSKFNRLLLSGQYVRLVQVTPFITQDARDLTWVHGIHLKGADSIHVASAIDRKCSELLTNDGRLVRLGKLNGQLQKFNLLCREGRQTEALPSKYKQLELGDGAIH